MKRLAFGGVDLVPMAVPTSWSKYLSMNKRFFFFRMVSSNTPILWWLGAPGGRVLAHNFMQCDTDSTASSCGMLVYSDVT